MAEQSPSSGERHEPEGWVFAHDMRKAHYQRHGRSLCGRYGLYPYNVLEPDNGPSKDDCAVCRRKLEASRA